MVGSLWGFPTCTIQCHRLGVVDSVDSSRASCNNNRNSVVHVVGRRGLDAHIDLMGTAEDCQRSKPDPQCFEIAAERLKVECARCLVFEDSQAGLSAGRDAGMRTSDTDFLVVVTVRVVLF